MLLTGNESKEVQKMGQMAAGGRLGKTLELEMANAFQARLRSHPISDTVRAARLLGVPLTIYDGPMLFTQFKGDKRFHLSSGCRPDGAGRREALVRWDDHPAKAFCDKCVDVGVLPHAMLAELHNVRVLVDLAVEYERLKRAGQPGWRGKFRKEIKVEDLTPVAAPSWEGATARQTMGLVRLANLSEVTVVVEDYRVKLGTRAKKTWPFVPEHLEWLSRFAETVRAEADKAQAVRPYRYSEIIAEVEAVFLEKALRQREPDRRWLQDRKLHPRKARREFPEEMARWDRVWQTWARTMREGGKAQVARERALHAWSWGNNGATASELAAVGAQCDMWYQHYFEELANSPAYVGLLPLVMLQWNGLSTIVEGLVSQVAFPTTDARLLLIGPRMFFECATWSEDLFGVVPPMVPLEPTDTAEVLETAAMLQTVEAPDFAVTLANARAVALAD